MKENLSQIIDKARERSIVVILAGMEAPPNFGQEYATGVPAGLPRRRPEQAGALHSVSSQQRGREAGAEPG